MSSRARRVTNQATVVEFPWEGVTSGSNHTAEPPREVAQQAAEAAAGQQAMLQREAYDKGYAEGEAAGAAGAREGADALLTRLTDTLQELTTVRAEMIRKTERQMVELALAVARRIVHREVSIDHDLLIAMTRVALERLSGSATVTVRFNPGEYEAIGGAGVASTLGTNVTIVADPRVDRGGCLVESDLGTLDVGIDAQIEEVARALLGEDPGDALSKVA
jgi:flagellar assembly protein FliH